MTVQSSSSQTYSREEVLSALPREVVAQLCAEDPEVFFHTVLGEAFHEPLADFHRFLAAVVGTEQLTARREVAGGPRGWGKSTTITEGGTLWIVARTRYLIESKRFKFILIVSDTKNQAEQRLFTIKEILKTNDELALYFPEAAGEGPIWRSDFIVTNNGVCIATAGMTSSIRGIRYKNRRPDLIIVDDPDSLDTVNSPTVSKELEERFNRDLLKCGHKRTDVIVVGTVLGKNALVYKLLNKDEYALWRGRIFKALETFPNRMDLWDTWGAILKDRMNLQRDDMAEEYYQANREEMEKGAQSNWLEVYSVKHLMREYYLEGKRAFLMEKQNEIIEDLDRFFSLETYQLFDEDRLVQVKEHNPLYFAYVDPTGGENASRGARKRSDSDRFACAVIAKLAPDNFALVDCAYGQFRQSQQFQRILAMIKKWGVFKLSVEKNAGGIYYINALKQYLLENNVTLVPRPVMNTISKAERIGMMEPYLDNGTLSISQSCTGVLDEMRDWPNSEWDDCLDATAGCFFSAFKTFRLRFLYNGD